ncbi:MAG: phosphoribosylamine--glycine ligase [Alphaproteobacteria bacterium]|nr:phosphoribosylamine--glycine ligase [Alphaproteobacteria bacterium]
MTPTADRNLTLLIVGSGGREHALAWRLAQSPSVRRVVAAPGNPGIARDAECVDVDPMDFPALTRLAQEIAADLVIVGPEAPLAAGLVDHLAAAGILAFGPTAAAARLESSKAFTKALCRQAGIPTADYADFTDAGEALAYLAAREAPFVLKADGLAAGKGVVIAATRAEAEDAVRGMLGGRFGEAGRRLVIEDFLEGEEASLFALTDGERLCLLPSAQDHKRAFDGDEGPNTGGMGAYSPAPVMTPALIETVRTRIFEPTLRAMAAQGTPYRGVLYAGLMLTAKGPCLIEYNVRFGDPEAQVLLMRLQGDPVPAFLAAARGMLAGETLAFDERPALTVVMAAKGYPGPYESGTPITGVDALQSRPDLKIFHAGTAMREGRLVARGGRVLNVTALGRTVAEAQARAYDAVDRIDWPEGFCRRDIGWRAVALEAETNLKGS